MSYNRDIGYFLRDEELFGFNYEISIKEILHREKTPFQLIEVVETIPFGRALITDGLIMITEIDECIYHEMMVHVPMSLVESPKNILIIGGGDGGCAREVSRYPTVESIDLVEIDKRMIEITKKYFKTWEGTNFEKLNIYIEDGFDFLKRAEKKYEVILLDISAPIEIAENLYSRESFNKIVSLLSEEGVFVIQSESIFTTPNVPKHIINQVKDIVSFVKVYYACIPSFILPWCFVIASKKNPPEIPKYSNLPKEELNKMKFYSREIHQASFVLPPFVKRYLESKMTKGELLNKELLREILG
ncbi:MAG: polyamine aminopropyltransferase [Brevinematia bacterium]